MATWPTVCGQAVSNDAVERSLEVARRRGLVTGGMRWLTPVAFMRRRFVGLALSPALSIASLALVVSPGLVHGVDFEGGSLIEVRAPERVDVEQLRRALQRQDLMRQRFSSSTGPEASSSGWQQALAAATLR